MNLLSGKPALAVVAVISLPVVLAIAVLGKEATRNLPNLTEIRSALQKESVPAESFAAQVMPSEDGSRPSYPVPGYIRVDAVVGSQLEGFTIVMTAPTMSECQMTSPIIIRHLPTSFSTAVPPQHVWYPQRGDSTVFAFQCKDENGVISGARKVIANK